MNHPHDHPPFLQSAALVNAGLLLMAVMGLTSPAVLHSTKTELQGELSTLTLSRFSSIIMLLAYAAYIYFQLVSHAHLYDQVPNSPSDDHAPEVEEEEEEEEILGFWGAIVWLGIITVFISILSEYLVAAIEGASETWSLPVSFISVIILPIVGNAAEHASAIVFALKNKLVRGRTGEEGTWIDEFMFALGLSGASQTESPM